MKSHFSELLLFLVLILMLGFTIAMSHIHNDSLASKGTEFAGQALAALLTLMVASKQATPPVGTTTTTSATTAKIEPVAVPASGNPLSITPPPPVPPEVPNA